MAAQKFSENNTSLDDEIVTAMASLNTMHAKTTSENKIEYDEIVDLVSASCERGIPGDLLVQILLKLPVKSLVCFKAVCKSWKLLIDSRVFINDHLHLHMKNPEYCLFPLLEAGQGNPSEQDDNILPSDINSIVGCCNGIICFEYTNHRENPLVLYNPSTREFCLAPEECSRYQDYAFCYVSQTNEYKILCFKPIFSDRNDVDMRIMTLGMKTKSFRDVNNVSLSAEICYIRRQANQATCGNSVFWFSHDDYFIPVVLCYDAFEDKFSTIKVPRSSYETDDIDAVRTLANFKNSLIMFDYSEEDYTSFDIWILVYDDFSKEKSLRKYRRVGPSETCCKPIHVVRDDRWILCSKSDEELDFTSNNLFYYDLETNQVEDYKETNQHIVVLQFVNYVETLVSPRHICLMS